MAVYEADNADFRAGRVVSRSFSTLFRNILPFGLIAMLLISPSYIYRIVAGVPDVTGMDEYGELTNMLMTEGALFLVELVLTYLVTAALVFGTIEDLRRNKVSIGDCISQGISRMLPVLGIAIVMTIVVILAFLPVAIGALVPLLIPVLIIPGIIVVLMLWVTIPVAVVERRGLGSLGRSMELTKGYKWRLLLLLLIVLVIVIAISAVIGGAIAGVMIAAGGELGETSVMAVVMEWVLSAFIAVFFSVLYAVSYHDLRVAKEGVDTDQIAAVFD